jgi:serine/threonine protein phosphatase PrpC
MSLQMYGATDQGLVRSNNQDAFFFSTDYGIVIVSDGMGGHKGGEIASRLVVDGLRDAFLESSEILLEHIGDFLNDVLHEINAEILRQSEANEKLRGMGATVNYLQFGGGMVAIGHAGDSRTYLLRLAPQNGEAQCLMWQLTVDHNVGTFVERGLLKLGELENTLTERQKSRLMRGMGVTANLKADVYSRQLRDGDVLLTCSDGVHGYVTDEAIAKAMCAGPIAKAPERLIELAKSVGAPDNVTAVVSVWSEDSEPLALQKPAERNNASYLVRARDGQITGPFTATEIIRKWTQDSISFDDEISASQHPWVFLKHATKLYSQYPEFDKPSVREWVARMAPPSTQAPSVIKTFTQKAFAKGHTGKTITAWCVALLLIGILILVLLTWNEYAMLKNTTLM